MMRVVIDTNVLVSGLLSPYGNSADILRLFVNGKLIPCYDSRILAEYHAVLHRPKFDFDSTKIDVLLKEIELTGQPVFGTRLQNSLPDPDDNMFVEVAVAGHADCIITGNLNHFRQFSVIRRF